MKTKKEGKVKHPQIKKENLKDISKTEFDSVMKKILSAPLEVKKKKSK
jgi:hypothetical protein